MLERLIITHASPTLSGIKCSSLMCIKNTSIDNKTLRVLEARGISSRIMRNRTGCPLLFLYRKDDLERKIQQTEERALLTSFGYDTSSLEKALMHLKKRLKEDNFPHEIGIFLGYPIEDVKSFIANEGRNYILSGTWKVYHNEDKARETFREYEKCTMKLLREYEKGYTLERLCV